MYCITEQQIDYILNDIRRNGVETEDLQLNLLDHVCCILEQTLKEHDDFERFYHETIPRFYKRELREIEEETINLLTFKNYYTMKKIMIVSGALSALALIAGSFFKIMYWPGASALLTLGILLVSFIFLPLMAVLKTREVNTTRDKLVAVIGALLGMLYAMSTLFAVMHWQGGKMLWLGTVVFSMFVFIPIYFFTGIRRAETKFNTIVTSVLLVGVTVLLFTMIGLRPSRQTQIQVYSYLHNEQLLKKIQHTSHVTDNALVADINSNCEQMKKIILQQEIGRTSVPADFEEQHITFSDRISKKLENDKQVEQLLNNLNTSINKYNAAQTSTENKIPVAHSILTSDQIGGYSGVTLLNHITQLQMYVAATDEGHVVTIR